MADRSGAIEVLVFGEALIDFFPTTTGVPLAEVETFRRHLGGAPANVAVGLARLGVRVGLMTLVGPDEFGRFARTQLSAEGIDVSNVGIHPSAKTGVTFVSVGAQGERSFLFFRHPSADQVITEAEVDPNAVGRAGIVHFGSSTLSREPARSATLKALAAARDSGAVVSIDPNWRPHLWESPSEARALIERVLRDCDLVKVSDDELEPLVGTDDLAEGARRIRALGPRLVVVTLGARGCFFDGACGSGALPGNLVHAVDSTGAGDGFVAGMLSILAPAIRAVGIDHVDRAVVERACVEGNRIGAMVVTQLGATTGILRNTEGIKRT